MRTIPGAGIACAAIGGDGDVRALRLAGGLAERAGLELLLVDVQAGRYPAPEPLTTGPLEPIPPVPAIEPDASPRDLAVLEDEAGVRAQRRERIGADVHSGLVELSRRPDVALVVAADDGGGALGAALGGNPARGAVRDLDVPYVLVPPGADGRLGDRPLVLCAVTDDAAAGAVVATGRELAGSIAGDLQAVEVLTGPMGAVRAMRTEIEMQEDEAPVEIEQVVAIADTEGVLREVAEARGAELIVVGRPHSGLVGSILGSVTHGLLKHGAIPVVVVPAPGDGRD